MPGTQTDQRSTVMHSGTEGTATNRSDAKPAEISREHGPNPKATPGYILWGAAMPKGTFGDSGSEGLGKQLTNAKTSGK